LYFTWSIQKKSKWNACVEWFARTNCNQGESFPDVLSGTEKILQFICTAIDDFFCIEWNLC